MLINTLPQPTKYFYFHNQLYKDGAHTQSRTGDLSLTKGVLYHLSYASHMERVAGIEPAQPAWKAGVLPLNYTRLIFSALTSVLLSRTSIGGGGWIRTTEACASDLQSDPFGHSGTPPTRTRKGRFPWLSHSGAAFYENWGACAIV